MNDEKDEQIYKAAKKLFSELGYKKTTMEKIAREAGISKGVISYYGKKHDYVERMFQDFLEKIYAAIIRDVGSELENSFQLYVLLVKISNKIINYLSPESRAFFHELMELDEVPQALHDFYRRIERKALDEFGVEVSDEYFYLYCEVERVSKLKISSDIYYGRIFIGDVTVYDFLSGLVMTLAGVPKSVVKENTARAKKLLNKIDFSDITVFV